MEPSQRDSNQVRNLEAVLTRHGARQLEIESQRCHIAQGAVQQTGSGLDADADVPMEDVQARGAQSGQVGSARGASADATGGLRQATLLGVWGSR
jgi:hypothetical protein|eukprot:4134223-Prymnesium_polylepis.1